ncbi:MAG: diacylglycerol kinase family lipid kinase [Rhodospirillaceae bacterium]|nr:diacylglycerol kinase family lipid kinase [Rhodospirillaceae bacterium]
MTDATLTPAARGPRRILAVFNPTAGGSRRARFERVIAALRAQGCAVTVQHTTARGDAEAIARALPPGTYDVIAAAGGDGTVNEIANGLTAPDCALGVIPLGTANVLAREIGLRLAPEPIARALAEGPVCPVRMGRANGRRFVMMAGIGFDANVVHGVSLSLKRRIGPLAYVWQAAKEALGGDFAPLRVTIDGRTHQATSAVICNGRMYGGPFVAAPAAALADDQFHVVLMPGRGWFSVLRYGLALVLGRLPMLRDVTIVAGRDIVAAGADGQPVQADGDIITQTPVHITLDPHPLKLVYPA